MILPAKHISEHRALLSIGAVILKQLDSPETVSALWEKIHSHETYAHTALHYNTFVLTLDLLFSLGAIDLNNGLLIRSTK